MSSRPDQQLSNCDPRNACLIKPSAFGDVVQALPLVSALNERFPETRWSWVINQGLHPLIEDHPGIDQVIRFPRHGSWGDWLRFLRQLRREQFDLVIDLQGLLRTGVMTRVTGAAVRVGLETAREGSDWMCQHIVPGTGRDVPAHSRYLKVAEAFGWSGDRPGAGLPSIEQEQKHVADLFASTRLTGARRPRIAFHPGARWVTKRWPIESYAEVAAHAADEFSADLIAVGAPEEKDDCQKLIKATTARSTDAKWTDLTGKTSLKQLTEVLRQVDVLVTNDSGPMHLADAVGTPVVGIFTCTSPVRSGPPGRLHELVQATVDCAASYKKQCPHQGEAHQCCFASVTPAMVKQALDRVIESNTLVRSA